MVEGLIGVGMQLDQSCVANNVFDNQHAICHLPFAICYLP